MMRDFYLVPKDYTEHLERTKIRALHETLTEAASRIQGPCMVVSTSLDSICIRLWNAPIHEPTREDIERCAFLPRDKLPIYITVLGLLAAYSDTLAKVTLQESFSCPANQLPYLINHLRAVATYQGFLSFYASVMLRADPSFN